MREFTDDEKRKILTKAKYTFIKGYCFDYEKTEFENIVVSEEEANAVIKAGSKEFWFDENCEYATELEDAFDSYIDCLDDKEIEELLK